MVKIVISHRGGVMLWDLEWISGTRMTLTNWRLKTELRHLVFGCQLRGRVAGWHNGIIEGGALPVNGEQTGSIN